MDLSTVFLPNSIQSTVVLTVILAFAGYMATFLSARMLARRRDKLDLVNRRLNEFYGPLYVASQAGNIAYQSLLKKQGKTQCHPIRDEEMKEWVLWMTTIFMPLNDIREKIIIEKAYLIVEEQMPRCLLDFVTHVVGYKAVLAEWAEGDYSERRSMIGWRPSSTFMWNTPTPRSRPGRRSCCTARRGGSTTGCLTASASKLGIGPQIPEPGSSFSKAGSTTKLRAPSISRSL
jgi:hypothetical protein